MNLLRDNLPQFLRYSAVSIVSFTLNFLLSVLFVEGLGHNPAYVVPLVFAGVLSITFTLHRIIVFESNGDLAAQAIQYVGSNIFFRLFDYGLIMTLLYTTPLPFTVIMGGVLAFGFIAKYFLFRVIFGQKNT